MKAQLSTGDIAIIGLSGDVPNDEFSWVALADLSAGEVIYFTDAGWRTALNPDAFGANANSNEGLIKFTVPAGGVTAGTIQTVTDVLGSDYTRLGLSTRFGNDTDLGISAFGDQIYVFQSTDSEANLETFTDNNLTAIFAASGATTNWAASVSTDAVSEGNLLPSLTNGVNAIAAGDMAGASDEFDNVRYTGTTTGTKVDLLAAICNINNWQGNDDPQTAGWTTNGAASFTVNPPNAPPEISVADLSYTAATTTAVQIDNMAMVTDTDGNWNGGTLTTQITTNPLVTDEISVQAIGNITVNGANGQISSSGTHFATADDIDASVVNNTLLTFTFNGNATDARIQELLRAISYRSSVGGTPFTAKTVTFNVEDADSATGTDNSTITFLTSPELDVRNEADDMDITDGSTTINMDLGTDFGTVQVGNNNPNNFRAENNGTANLNFLADAIALSGSSDFTITQDIPTLAMVTPTGIRPFQITFTPNSMGTKTATVTLNSDDLDENPYTFLIQGVGVAPEIEVSANSTDITDGDMTANAQSVTMFTPTCINGDMLDITYTIANTGTANLSLSGTPTVDLIGANGHFSITQPGLTTLTPSQTTTFTVTFNPSSIGSKTATISIVNNDSDENPFNYVIEGTGTQATVSIAISGNDNEDENSGNTISYVFTRTGCLTETLDVSFAIAGTANDENPGDDFNVSFTGTGASGSYTDGTNSGTITIGNGEATATLVVTPLGDNTVEADEIVVVSITP